MEGSYGPHRPCSVSNLLRSNGFIGTMRTCFVCGPLMHIRTAGFLACHFEWVICNSYQVRYRYLGTAVPINRYSCTRSDRSYYHGYYRFDDIFPKGGSN